MSIETYPRKRLEMIVELPHLPRFVELLDSSNVRGYTILPSVSGKGSRGAWIPTRLTDAVDKVMVVAVLDESTAAAVLKKLAPLFDELPGVAFVSDVEVLRPERF